MGQEKKSIGRGPTLAVEGYTRPATWAASPARLPGGALRRLGNEKPRDIGRDRQLYWPRS